MKNKFIVTVSSILTGLAFLSCSPQVSPNASTQDQGILQSVIGGLTEAQAHDAGSTEVSKFEAIAQHMAMVMVESTDENGNTHPVEMGSAVIVSDRFIITSAHIFEGHIGSSAHVGKIYFGSSGPYENRIYQNF